jgi:hypothetical protein
LLEKLVPCAGYLDLAVAQDIRSIRKLNGERGSLFHDEHRNAIVTEPRKLREDRFDDEWRQAEGGFVEHHQVWAREERPRNGQLLLLSSG